MRVLICDDDGATRFVAKRLVDAIGGHTVAVCDNGQEAVALAQRGAMDLLVLDIEMPNVDGLTALRLIRASAASRQLPVIVLSRENREEVVRELVGLGVSGYVLKPLNASNLTDTVRRVARPSLALPAAVQP